MGRWGLVLIAGISCGCGDTAPPEAADEPVPAAPEARPEATVASPREPVEPPASAEPEAEPLPEPGTSPVEITPTPAESPAETVSPLRRDPIARCRDIVARGGPYTQCIIQSLEGRARTCRELAALIEAYRAAGYQPATDRHLEEYIRRDCRDGAPGVDPRRWRPSPQVPGDYPPHLPMHEPARDDHPYGPLDRDRRFR